MDVYLMQHGGVALWITAVCAVVIVLLLWLIANHVVRISRKVAPLPPRGTGPYPPPAEPPA